VIEYKDRYAMVLTGHSSRYGEAPCWPGAMTFTTGNWMIADRLFYPRRQMANWKALGLGKA
jgi:hypothetical protein